MSEHQKDLHFGMRNPLNDIIKRAAQAGFLSQTVHSLAEPDKGNGLGQNHLTNRDVMGTFQKHVIPGRTVFEVGPGFGGLTEWLAEPAGKLIGIEADRRFNRVLSEIAANSQAANAGKGKIGFINANALEWQRFINLDDPATIEKLGGKPQIISNLPFGIASQFMAGLVGTPIENAVLFLGEGLGKQLAAKKEDKDYWKNYGSMTPIAPFFKTENIGDVGWGSFYPKRDTTGKIVRMTPIDVSEAVTDTETRIFAQIFRDTGRELEPPTVLTSMSQALGESTTDVVTRVQKVRKQPHSERPFWTETATWLQQPYFGMNKAEVREFGRLVHLLNQS